MKAEKNRKTINLKKTEEKTKTKRTHETKKEKN
jgi:hypothetical protein